MTIGLKLCIKQPRTVPPGEPWPGESPCGQPAQVPAVRPPGAGLGPPAGAGRRARAEQGEAEVEGPAQLPGGEGGEWGACTSCSPGSWCMVSGKVSSSLGVLRYVVAVLISLFRF